MIIYVLVNIFRVCSGSGRNADLLAAGTRNEQEHLHLVIMCVCGNNDVV